MKTALRSLLLTAIFGLSIARTYAQCVASDIVIQNVVPVGVQTSGTCTATFDLSFNMQNNNGNKFIFLHVWAASAYPDFFDCVNGAPSGNGAIQPPQAGDLTGAFINIGINNNGAVPVLLTSYPPDPSVTLNSAVSVTGTVLADGSVSFVIQNVTATFPVDCNTPFVMIADLWSSQGAQAQIAQCVNCNIAFAINFMATAGLANCATLTYSATVTNRIGTALGGFYRVYADANNDGVLSFSNDSLIRDTTTFSLGAGVGTTTVITGTIPPVNINQSLFIVVELNSGLGAGSTIISTIPTTLCAPLPVVFSSFTANRVNRTTVALRWQTATEINNNGFEVQRNMGNGTWQAVGFVPTQSTSGTSNTTLTYTFTDINTNKGITQYRIKQVDIDNRSRYSEIRSVRGDGQNGKLIIYPNPSADGRVNVVFDDMEGTRDVSLMDMSGRVVKQWKNIVGNTLELTNLQPGFYTIRIIVRETGFQSVGKIAVSNTVIK